MRIQDFVVVSVYPRSIAWLICPDEWDRFETIVKYNCAIVGGYFNVIIPTTEQGSLTDEYSLFLIDYDPDIVILAPGMAEEQLQSTINRIRPFAFIPWKAVTQIATLDAWGGLGNTNARLGPTFDFNRVQRGAVVAVADESCPDFSRLALVMCGEVQPCEPSWLAMDDDLHMNATGHREVFLRGLLRSECNSYQIEAYATSDGRIIPAPDRYRLKEIIAPECQFPLSGTAEVLEVCCKLQHYPKLVDSFIGITARYKQSGGTPHRKREAHDKPIPAIAILVSEHLSMEEVALLWNLRANEVYAAWLSFSELEKDVDAVARWLDSDYGGSFYKLGRNIAFSARRSGIPRLQSVIEQLESKRRIHYDLEIRSHKDLVFYNYVRPGIIRKRLLIAQDGKRCTLHPETLTDRSSGLFTIKLEWDDLRLPQDPKLVKSLISQETISGFVPPMVRNDQVIHRTGMVMPKFRVTADRYLAVQFQSGDSSIVFDKPSPIQVIQSLFESAGFYRVEISSAGRYHTSFVDNAGGLEKAAVYLTTSPYRELLETLSDNTSRNKTGWILQYPDKRRALHHDALLDLMGCSVPAETRTYFDTVSDELPDEVVELLKSSILERGFLLVRGVCSYRSWYSAELAGQVFECQRCRHSQIIASNPLWLYKLREVVFQGFADNMQVPLLALSYLKRTSRHFDWIPDSDVYWLENGEENSRNVDLLCLCDGRFYVGEAKSSDNIPDSQFSFYEALCQRLEVDGVVLATTQPRWGRGTQDRVKQLSATFPGKVIVLTESDLYQGSSNP